MWSGWSVGTKLYVGVGSSDVTCLANMSGEKEVLVCYCTVGWLWITNKYCRIQKTRRKYSECF
jgi:hypothetical protein